MGSTFPADCRTMLRAIEQAADPAYPEWQPYRGYVVDEALYLVRYVIRRARALGLYSDVVEQVNVRALRELDVVPEGETA